MNTEDERQPVIVSVIEQNKYQNIGGWLFVPGLILLTGAAGSLVVLFTSVAFALSPSSSSVVAFAIFDAVRAVLTCVLVIYTTVLFFMKKRQLPACYTMMVLFITVVCIIDDWIGAHFYGLGLDTDDIKEYVSCTFQILVWLPYFHISKRVKLTFVN